MMESVGYMMESGYDAGASGLAYILETYRVIRSEPAHCLLKAVHGSIEY